MKQLFIHIKTIYVAAKKPSERLEGKAMSQMEILSNAFIEVEHGRIIHMGNMAELETLEADQIIDCSEKSIIPTWCDSHTHTVFAAPRATEFELKIKGKTYEEIAAAGGGILNSAKHIQNMDIEQLYEISAERLHQLILQGTGAIEIKSGYGLTVDAEIKMLRVIQKLKENFAIPIKATFLGAHAFPQEYKTNHAGYINLLVHEMLPKIAEEKLADFIDVFCEQGFFSNEETIQILEAGARYNLIPKIHANQLSCTGAVETAIACNALSVDHLEQIDDAVIQALQNKKTIATVLPSCSFFIRIPYAPARQMIDAGLSVAIASDFNPGSSPSGNMNFVVSLACIQQRLLPEEAIHAATINGAYAMNLSTEVGTISVGKRANFILTKKIDALAEIPYSFGASQIDSVYINGIKYS